AKTTQVIGVGSQEGAKTAVSAPVGARGARSEYRRQERARTSHDQPLELQHRFVSHSPASPVRTGIWAGGIGDKFPVPRGYDNQVDVPTTGRLQPERFSFWDSER